jgi:hypothetical protein
MTGINFLGAELAAKRLGLLRELVPRGCSRCRTPQSGRGTAFRVDIAKRGSCCWHLPLHAVTNFRP